MLPGPVPLRSPAFPEGLQNLSVTNRIRVSKANKLYEFVGETFRFAHARNLIIVVENPRLDDQVVASSRGAHVLRGTPGMCIPVVQI